MPASLTFSTRFIFGVCLPLTLFGCERYAVTLNQQPIYTPPPLYGNFAVEDLALRDCIKQTIVDQNVVKIEQLTTLTCRHAGVTSLSGLDHFTSLQQIDVSHNQLVDAEVLAKLPQLKMLKIQENAALRCDTLGALVRNGVQVTAPAHCVADSSR